MISRNNDNVKAQGFDIPKMNVELVQRLDLALKILIFSLLIRQLVVKLEEVIAVEVSL